MPIRSSDFKMETRPYGDGFANFVGITCGWCGHEGWHPAKNGGWAMRIFRVHGWRVGSKPTQHRCPSCFGKARNAARNRSPDNPAIPKEIGKVIKERIIREHLLGSVPPATMASHAVRDAPPPYEAPIVPPDPPQAAAPAPEPGVAYRKPDPGHKPIPGLTVWPIDKRGNAARSAQSATGGTDGLDFFTVKAGGGWTWKLPADTTDAERVAWAEGRKFGPRPYPTRKARDHLVPHVNKKETTMTVIPIAPRKDTSMPTPAHIDEPRLPTRDERSLIHDELTKVYDNVDQRYSKDDSDKSVAARLDVPRAWVTDIRAMFFGDYDRNAESEKHKKHLEASIVIAKAATSRLMELAAEAEGIQVKLEAQLKGLVG